MSFTIAIPNMKLSVSLQEGQERETVQTESRHSKTFKPHFEIPALFTHA